MIENHHECHENTGGWIFRNVNLFENAANLIVCRVDVRYRMVLAEYTVSCNLRMKHQGKYLSSVPSTLKQSQQHVYSCIYAHLTDNPSDLEGL